MEYEQSRAKLATYVLVNERSKPRKEVSGLTGAMKFCRSSVGMYLELVLVLIKSFDLEFTPVHIP